MNPQIRALAIKSGIDVRGHLTGNLMLDEKPGVYDLSKFAELIVKECAELTRWREKDMSAEQRIRLEIYQEIKQHFGVTE
jgi:hypothetical protein